MRPTTDRGLLDLAARLDALSWDQAGAGPTSDLTLAAEALRRAARHKLLLEEMCETVDALTLERNEDGYASPVGTDGWSDIGKVYVDACEELGREPVWDEGEEFPGGWRPPNEWFDDEGGE